MAKFDFEYNRSYQDGIKFNTLVTEFENGKEQRRPKSPPRRVFSLKFEKSTTTSTDAQDIWDFFVARQGKYESFQWDYEHPDGNIEEVTVRFEQDTLNREVFFNNLYSHGLKFIEVL